MTENSTAPAALPQDGLDDRINAAQDALRAAQRTVSELVTERLTATLRADRPAGGALYTRDTYEDGEHDILLLRLTDRNGAVIASGDGPVEVWEALGNFDAVHDDLLTLWWTGCGWRHGEEWFSF